MNRLAKHLFASVALLASLSFAPAAFAGPAQDTVQARRNEVVAKLKEASSPEREKKIAAIVANLFDFDAMAKESLGKNWNDLTDEQKVEFTGLLKQLVQRSLEKNIKTTQNYDVAFIGEEAVGDDILVKTRATKKGDSDDPLAIDYVMHKVSDAWKSIDVVTEGASMVGNYRSQFRRVIAKDGFAGLIKKMKEKLKSSA